MPFGSVVADVETLLPGNMFGATRANIMHRNRARVGARCRQHSSSPGRSARPGSAREDRVTHELSAWTVEPRSCTNEIPDGFSLSANVTHHNWYYHVGA